MLAVDRGEGSKTGMKFAMDPNRGSYFAAYAAICAFAVLAAALQRHAPEIRTAAVCLQLLLPFIAGLCLMPAASGSTAVLPRGFAIGIALASAAINVGCFTIIHLGTGLRVATGTRESVSVLDGLYFSAATLATLGFGDLQPSPQGRLAAAFQALSGYAYLALGIGLAASGFRTSFGDGGGQNANR